MFDRIQFVDIPTTQYRTKEALHLDAAGTNNYLPALSAKEIQELSTPAMDGNHCLSGRIRLMAPLPITQEAKRYFLYVQSFSLLQSDENYYTQRQYSATYLLVYTYAGKGKLQYKGKQYLLGPGDGFLIDCRIPHRYETVGTLWEHGDLHFDGQSASPFFNAFSRDQHVCFSRELEGRFQAQIEALLWEYQYIRTSRDLRVHAALTDLLAELVTGKEVAPQGSDGLTSCLQSLILYMKDHSADHITMEQLSKTAGISKFHLSREFKKLTGQAPIEYLITLRIENAKYLLWNTSLPLYAIAEQTGIGNEQYFSRLFSSRVGTTPGKFRKSNSK